MSNTETTLPIFPHAIAVGDALPGRGGRIVAVEAMRGCVRVQTEDGVFINFGYNHRVNIIPGSL